MEWNTPRITSLLERALSEDHVFADTTTQLTIAPDALGQAEIIAKQECVLAGLGLVPRVFACFSEISAQEAASGPGLKVVTTHHPEIFDGVSLHSGQTLAVLSGPARALLSCERVTLNLLQHMCGVATLTRQYVEAVQGTRARILDTRKTAPGLRVLDKYAVTCGGGHNHRSDLSDAILIKNNHIRLAGGVAAALARAQQRRRPSQYIEIEVRTPEELHLALSGGAERLLLDNMTPAQVRDAVAVIAGRAQVEVSGGVRLSNVRAYAETGVDFISVGALTHSAPGVDLAMRIVPMGSAGA